MSSSSASGANFSHREEMLVLEFFSLGIQYYFSARFAAFAGFIPISGNLAHHAVEMCLKGHLSRTMTEEQLRRSNHNLTGLWFAFKNTASDPNLDVHDETITEVSSFEDIRYPQKIISNGMAASINVGRRVAGGPGAVSGSNPPFYGLNLGEVDGLMKDICLAARIDPVFYTQGFRPEAKRALLDANVDSVFWTGQ